MLTFDGAGDYLEIDTVETADLNFITDDYSIVCWINWADTGTSEMIIGRYELDVSGWEIYLFKSGDVSYLTQRHHHAGTLVDGHPRTASSSVGWAPGTYMVGITRVGGGSAEGKHYRNGAEVTVTSSVGGVLDPETCAQDLVIGTKYTKNTDWFKGDMYRPRIWNRVLSSFEMGMLFAMERSKFGV
jgi:hypothetical protein